jgi:thiosulfate/3-mercaptopyruvate sulfurtransferase
MEFTVMEFTHPEYLVSTDWLADHLDDVRVLDVTAKLTSKLENHAEADCFRDAHIPGSVFFDVASGKGVLSDRTAALPWMWPSAEQIAASLADAGVGPATRVVLVARTPRDGIDSGTMWCTRAWWTLHHAGVDCAILQGGLEQWEREGRPLTSAPTTIAETDPVSVAPRWRRGRADITDVQAVLDGAGCLVDALPPESFHGTGPAYGPRGGHITGARNVPFRSLIDAETAGFVDAETMHRVLSEGGLLEDQRVVTYCGGAIAATVDAFALALFGKTDVAVYDGSLMEWSANPDLPMTNPSNSAA